MAKREGMRPTEVVHVNLAQDGDLGGGLGRPEGAPSYASTLISDIRSAFANCAPTLESPAGFFDVHRFRPSNDRYPRTIMGSVDALVRSRKCVAPQQLDVTDPSGIHSKIFVGADYSKNGPVLVHAGHLKQIFSTFTPPSKEEIDARTSIGKENYGTMPGIDSAYAGAIVKAMQPRTILVIGEHKGHLTKYLAECSSDDCLIFTLDLPQSIRDRESVTPLDKINNCFVNYSENQIGEAWRGTAVADRIIGLAGDSTSSAAAKVFKLLNGLIDLVIVDGDHSYESVVKDLTTAKDLLSDKGVILVDDFWKPARLFEVTEAALRVRRENPEISHLYHISWGVDPDKITSNLAFFVKGE